MIEVFGFFTNFCRRFALFVQEIVAFPLSSFRVFVTVSIKMIVCSNSSATNWTNICFFFAWFRRNDVFCVSVICGRHHQWWRLFALLLFTLFVFIRKRLFVYANRCTFPVCDGCSPFRRNSMWLNAQYRYVPSTENCLHQPELFACQKTTMCISDMDESTNTLKTSALITYIKHVFINKLIHSKVNVSQSKQMAVSTIVSSSFDKEYNRFPWRRGVSNIMLKITFFLLECRLLLDNEF